MRMQIPTMRGQYYGRCICTMPSWICAKNIRHFLRAGRRASDKGMAHIAHYQNDGYLGHTRAISMSEIVKTGRRERKPKAKDCYFLSISTWNKYYRHSQSSPRLLARQVTCCLWQQRIYFLSQLRFYIRWFHVENQKSEQSKNWSDEQQKEYR